MRNLHIHIVRDAPLRKFTKGQVVRVDGAGSWTGGKQIPFEKMVVDDPRVQEHHGEPTIGIAIYYSKEVQKEFHMDAIEYSWAYISQVH